MCAMAGGASLFVVDLRYDTRKKSYANGEAEAIEMGWSYLKGVSQTM